MSKFFLKIRFCFQFPFDLTSLPLKAINLKGYIFQNEIKQFHKFRKLKFIPLPGSPLLEKLKPKPKPEPVPGPPIPKRIGEIVGRYAAGRGRVRYSCKVGDHFDHNEVVMEIETNKACLNITSPSNGTLKQIFVKDGERVKPGTLLFKLEKDLLL